MLGPNTIPRTHCMAVDGRAGCDAQKRSATHSNPSILSHGRCRDLALISYLSQPATPSLFYILVSFRRGKS